MHQNHELIKLIKKYSRKLYKSSPPEIKKHNLWLLRTCLIIKKQPELVHAGFVLPTVAMVALVVVLITTAILFRSFERSKNASNVRVNEAVLNAAAPAIDRARAKLDALFSDPTLPRGTPSDSALYDALKKDKYRLGDETRLKLAHDINNNNSIDTTGPIENDETLRTAWKFAVDTDNNGLRDSYTLYGIYFRSPSRNSSGQFDRERKPLDARTPPMDNGLSNAQCATATGFSSLVGSSSWVKLQSGSLGKSFFVYTVNVPITKSEYDGLTDKTGFEPYKGNKGFVALEFQQDRTRIPLPYNAVWFENDLEIITGATSLNLNGRIHTNGNLLVGVTESAGSMTIRQVSSKTSCFYNQENGQISVGGNVGNGSVAQTSANDVTIDLFNGFGNNVNTSAINATNKSTNSTGGGQIGFNDTAYNQRIAAMKRDAIAQCSACGSATDTSGLKTAVTGSGYPEEIRNNFAARVDNNDDLTTAQGILNEEIEIYLRNRTRRVPYAEVPDGTAEATATAAFSAFSGAGDINPPAVWREPIDSSSNLTSTTIGVLTSQLEALFPDLQKQLGIQRYLGDRVLVGNNLPAKWLQGTTFVGPEAQQMIASVNWTEPTSPNTQQRWRNTQIQALADLGISDRNGFWEEKAAEAPVNDLDSVGGVRLVTGAGLYLDGAGVSNPSADIYYGRDTHSFLLAPNSSDSTVVWPDTMPMSSPTQPTKTGDLIMRATVVYHYKLSAGIDQAPLACISSYYDPTDATTAKNISTLPWNTDANGKSNNGIVYSHPGRATFATNKARLQRQADLKFPNGRWVNEPLRDALAKIGTGTTIPSTGLQQSDYSAIDAALCSIHILNGASPVSSGTANMPPHGAVREATFLDGREIKQISAANPPTEYDLDLEQRQPSEVRVTDIDLAAFASTSIPGFGGSSEYLLPYSGIIYATREDALRDESVPRSNTEYKLLSPTDFVLDSTRRPSGIRLINGQTLARDPATNNNSYNAREKGLILVTNLPAYIKGTFNLHRATTSDTTEIEEFTETEATTNFYNRSTPNTKFACRIGRTGCSSTTGEGDLWRPATIIADSMTLLSGGFVDGFRNEGDFDLNNNTGVPIESGLSSPNSLPTNSTRRERLKNGFWENNFVTSADWTTPGATGDDKLFPRTSLGSYVFNGVTPIQRRVDRTPMYVMEICRRNLVSDCTPSDWVVGFDANGDGDLNDPAGFDVNGDGTVDANDLEKDVRSYQLGQAIAVSYLSYDTSNRTGHITTFRTDDTLLGNEFGWFNTYTTADGANTYSKSIRDRLGAGDTGDKYALVSAERRYPRRVAFARNDNHQLIAVGSNNLYKPIGVGCPLDVTKDSSGSGGYTYNYNNNGCTYGGTTEIEHYGTRGYGLWFRTTNSTTNPSAIANATYRGDNPLFYYPPVDADGDGTPDPTGQPLLVPVLQIHDAKFNIEPTFEANFRADRRNNLQEEYRSRWIRTVATPTIYNATFVLGNSPSRPAEISAGLQNLVRFLEAWRFSGTNTTVKISGSFIQLKRSAYATAPIGSIFSARQATDENATVSNNLSLFDYTVDSYPNPNANGVSPFYSPPNRSWGFDVGLLSEQPDLFAQRFTAPPTGRPNEFFREVGRDDLWVKTLLCAGKASNQTGVIPSGGTVTYSRAVPTEYRPSSCPTIPNN